MKLRNIKVDFLLGIITSFIGSWLYSGYQSGDDEILSWVFANFMEVLFLFSCIFFFSLWVLVYFHSRCKKTKLHCPHCPTVIEKFELVTGARIVGCICQKSSKVTVTKDTFNVEKLHEQ